MEPLHIGFSTPFPPFPSAPPGAVIIPYKEFKEHGIKAVKNRDGQEVDGVGVPTAILPIREEPISNFEWDSGSQHQSTPLRLRSGDRKLWWNYWSEQDDKRSPFAFNPQQPRLDRIYSALSSFRGSRRWPFERNEKLGPTYFWEQFRIFIGASGYPPVWNRTDKSKPKEDPKLISPDYFDGPVRPPYAYFNVKPVDIDSDEAVRELLELDKLRREEHLIDFLEDPEKAVKIFLSSYSRTQGFWWSDDNLDIMPRVLCFFFRFLLKHRVFPAAKDERKYQKALSIAESGYKELPLTSVVAKFLPGQFSIACVKYWGQQRRHSAWSDDEDSGDDISDESGDDDDVLLVSNGAGIQSTITKINFDKGKGAGDLPKAPTPPALISKPIPEALKMLLSPTNLFPASHTLGFVEQSLRQVKQVLPPGAFASPQVNSYHSTPSDTPTNSIDVIEHDLELKLAKVILAPWIRSATNEYNTPEVLRRPNNFSEIQTVEDGLNEHDPLEDEITVLVSVAERYLGVLKDTVGMGIAGTWVQLRPVGEEGMNPRRLKYWYLEEHNLVVPSFEAC